jgi:hypothetical protein
VKNFLVWPSGGYFVIDAILFAGLDHCWFEQLDLHFKLLYQPLAYWRINCLAAYVNDIKHFVW